MFSIAMKPLESSSSIHTSISGISLPKRVVFDNLSTSVICLSLNNRLKRFANFLDLSDIPGISIDETSSR